MILRTLLRIAAFAAPLTLVACDRASIPDARADGSPAPAPAADGAASTTTTIQLDPRLIEQGRVRVVTVASAQVLAQLELPGEVVPAADGEAEVGSIVQGRVVELSAAEGDRVEKGQILARIESSEVGRASAELLRARAHAQVADRKLARQLDLQKQGATSETAIDEARAEAEAGRADLLAARTLIATLGGAEPSAGAGAVRLALRSPIAGVITRRTAMLGAPVGPDSSLFRIVAPDRLLVRARLPETSASAPKVGDHAQARPRAHRGDSVPSCDLVVTSSFGVIDEATRTVPILLRPEGPCAFLLPGAYVDAILRAEPRITGTDGDTRGVVVPAEAVVDIRGVPTIFVALAGPASFQPRRVRTGVTEGGLVRIEAGVEAGERVVVAGAVLLKGEVMRADLGGE